MVVYTVGCIKDYEQAVIVLAIRLCLHFGVRAYYTTSNEVLLFALFSLLNTRETTYRNHCWRCRP